MTQQEKLTLAKQLRTAFYFFTGIEHEYDPDDPEEEKRFWEIWDASTTAMAKASKHLASELWNTGD